ncbi:MAG: InlB B-repeat-containing protein [Bacteroidales bacterium]|nr:InlB B-repeat-containing protein [Bacteroidales bacterium]
MKKSLYCIVLSAIVCVLGCSPEEPTPEVLNWRYQQHFGEDGQPKTDDHYDTPTVTECTVYYKSEYGTCPTSVKVKYGQALSSAQLPVIELSDEVANAAYYFDGWYIGDNKVDASYKVKQNVTLTAKWRDRYCTLTFPQISDLKGKTFWRGSEKIEFASYPTSGSSIIAVFFGDDNETMSGYYSPSSGSITFKGGYSDYEDWYSHVFLDDRGRFFLQVDSNRRGKMTKSTEGLVGKWTFTDSFGDVWYTVIPNNCTNSYGYVRFVFEENNEDVSALYDGTCLYVNSYLFTQDKVSKSGVSKPTNIVKNIK